MTKFNFLKGQLRQILIWPAVGLVLLSSVWALTLLQLGEEKKVAERHALESVGSLSKAYAQYLQHSLEQMDQITRQLKYDWERSGATLRLDELKKNGLYTASQFAIVVVFDKHGDPVTATLPKAGLRANFNLGDTARRQAGGPDTMSISIGRRKGAAGAAGKALVNFSRQLEDAHGNFAGEIVIAVDPAYFAEFYDSYNLGQHGLLSMVGIDGDLYSTRVGAEVVGLDQTPFTDTHFMAHARGATKSVGRVAFADKQTRFLGWQSLDTFPFTAVIGLADREVLRPYLETRAIYIAIASGVSGLLLIFTAIASFLSYRLALRQHQSEGVRNAYRMATEGTSDGFYIVAAIRDERGEIADFEFVDCNEPGAGFFGVGREQLLGVTLGSCADDPYFIGLMQSYKDAMASGFSELEIELAPGNPLGLAWIRRRLVRSGDRLAVTVQDISAAKSHERELLRMANEDGLTGLPNRHWLGRFLPGALARAEQAQTRLALLFIDLDGFKDINDTKGHAEGDQVLRAVSLRLKTVLRPDDHVVRIGGDEFVVVLDPVEGDPRDSRLAGAARLSQAESDRRVARVAERIAEAFEEPFYLADGRHKMGTSIGISVFPRDGLDTETLLKNADIAMYAVKMAGKGHHRFYEPELYEVIRSRRDIEQSLNDALEREEFIIHYQPRVDALTGELCSMEALVRWQHPQRGLVPPLEFIPVAESSGLISRLGENVIEQVCRQQAAWRALGMELLPVSINVSARQFARGDVHQVLSAALHRHHIEARHVEVEITESAMMGDQTETIEQLAALRAHGVKLLVDDFGTGYSSLSQLQRFAMDGLKIDRAFTSELGRSHQGEIFIRAILSMAHALGMSVVAEGVETREQLDILRALSCNEVQGYFISRPVPAEQMLALMRKRFLIDMPESASPYWPVG